MWFGWTPMPSQKACACWMSLGPQRALTYLPRAQQNYPHQDHIDVGPQGLIVVDFIDLKDNQEGFVSRNLRPQDQLWLANAITTQPAPRPEPWDLPRSHTLLPLSHTVHLGSTNNFESSSSSLTVLLPIMPCSHHPLHGLLPPPPQCLLLPAQAFSS